jgi:cell division protein FtsQ
VRHASARRSFPDTVVISVEERTPVALVQLDKLYLVDVDGTIFAQAHDGDYDHPMLTGIDASLAESQPEVARRLVTEGLAWLDAAQKQGGLAEKDLSELRFDTRTGYTLFLRNGGEVLLGFADRERVARLSQLTAQGLDLSAPHRVDLASERLAVVTPL